MMKMSSLFMTAISSVFILTLTTHHHSVITHASPQHHIHIKSASANPPKAFRPKHHQTAHPHPTPFHLQPNPVMAGSFLNRNNDPIGLGWQVPSWGVSSYSSSAWLNAVTAMQSETHAGWVGIDVKICQPNAAIPSITPANHGLNTSLASLNTAIQEAHALGLKVFLRPILIIESGGGWTGSIQYSSPQEQAQWFASYTAAWLPYAKLAQQDHVQLFSIGTELSALQQDNPVLWNQMINRISRVYAGPLTVSLNWSSIQYEPWMANTHLTTMGVDAYFPWTGNSTAPLSTTANALAIDWDRDVLPLINQLHEQTHLPITLTEVGYATQSSALNQPWQTSASSLTNTSDADQVTAYTAFSQAVKHSTDIRNVFFWDWNQPSPSPDGTTHGAVTAVVSQETPE